MDRRDRSLLVQFWLIVEGLKDPLEDLSQIESASASAADDEASDTALLISGQISKSDIEMIWTTYLVTPSGPLWADPRHFSVIKEFLETSEGVKGLSKARRAIFAIQRQVFEDMEEVDYKEFLGRAGGDLYIKVAENLQAAQTQNIVQTSRTPSSTSTHEIVPSYVPRRRTPSPVRTRSESALMHHKPTTTTTSSTSVSSTSYLPSLLSMKHPRTEKVAPSVEVEPAIGSRSANSSSTDLASSVRFAGRGRVKSVTPENLEFLMGGGSGGSGLTTPSESRRAPLFEDDTLLDEAAMTPHGNVHDQTIEALQEALTSILTSDSNSLTDEQRHSPKPPSVRSLNSPDSPDSSPSAVGREATLVGETTEVLPPPPTSEDNNGITSTTSSVRSSGSTKTIMRHRRKTVFDDDDVSSSEVELDISQKSGGKDRNVRFAGPGELELPNEIAKISDRLQKLESQQAVVDAMIRKAELTGTQSELKILAKSADALRHEVRDLTFQKSQYEAQATENVIVPGRTNVSISGTTFSEGADGRQFVLYVVEVHQLGADGTYTSGWFLTRRYSEFSTLHNTLREKYAAVRALDLPSKRLVPSMNAAFIEQRRTGLERYLQVSLLYPLCEEDLFKCPLLVPALLGPRYYPSRLPERRIALVPFATEYHSAQTKRGLSFTAQTWVCEQFERTGYSPESLPVCRCGYRRHVCWAGNDRTDHTAS
jgi:sorting nexin-25